MQTRRPLASRAQNWAESTAARRAAKSVDESTDQEGSLVCRTGREGIRKPCVRMDRWRHFAVSVSSTGALRLFRCSERNEFTLSEKMD